MPSCKHYIIMANEYDAHLKYHQYALYINARSKITLQHIWIVLLNFSLPMGRSGFRQLHTYIYSLILPSICMSSNTSSCFNLLWNCDYKQAYVVTLRKQFMFYVVYEVHTVDENSEIHIRSPKLTSQYPRNRCHKYMNIYVLSLSGYGVFTN